MKALLITGVILIILGIAGLVYGGFSYEKTDHASLGPIKLEATHEKSVPIPPILNYVAIAGGAVLVFFGARKS